MSKLKEHIRTVIDFPVKGVHFRDITTLLLEPAAFKMAIDEMRARCEQVEFDAFVAIESRGFIFASTLAYHLDKPLALVRKPNKLPAATISEKYECEYSANTLEIHSDALKKGARALVVDDLLATGGTVVATSKLLRRMDVEVALCMFLIDLPDLKGGEKLAGQDLAYHALMEFAGD